MLSKEPIINAEDEAKALGLKNQDTHVEAALTPSKTADPKARMERQSTLRASGKIAKQGV